MKKIFSLILALALSLSLTACTGGSSAGNSIAGDTGDLIKKVIENVEADSETKDWLTSNMQHTEITAENMEYMLGKADFKIASGTAVEPMMTSQAFSLVLVRAESAEAAETLAADVKAAVNPNKWICVGVDPSDVKTATIGDLMLLVMADNSQIYIDAFNKLKG